MRKLLFFLIVLLFAGQIAKAQITVDNYGRVGIPTVYNMDFKCQVTGNLLLTSKTYTIPRDGFGSQDEEFFPLLDEGVELRLKVLNSSVSGQADKATIGSSNGEVRFWTDIVGYNNIRYLNAYSGSDSTIKTNVMPLKKTLDLVKSLKAYSYNFKPIADSTGEIINPELTEKTHFGFLSQEVEHFLPELVVNDETGLKMLDYTSITPLLTNAMQEQQQIIDLQQEVINMLQRQAEQQQANIDHLQMRVDLQQAQIDWLIAQVGTTHGVNFLQGGNPNNGANNEPNFSKVSTPEEFALRTGKLYDCIPNPFSVKTDVRFEIPENAVSAKLMIHDLNGKEIKSYNIAPKGLGTITINGYELEAGMYVYTLLVDNTIVDSKKMILTQ